MCFCKGTLSKDSSHGHDHKSSSEFQSWIHRLSFVWFEDRISISSNLFYSKALASCHTNLFDSTTWVSDHSAVISWPNVHWFSNFRFVYRIYSDSLSLWFGNRFPTWESLLLGYDAASRGSWIPSFRSNISPSSSRVEPEDVSTLEDKDTVLPRNVGTLVPFDVELYPRRAESSAVPLRKSQSYFRVTHTRITYNHDFPYFVYLIVPSVVS